MFGLLQFVLHKWMQFTNHKTYQNFYIYLCSPFLGKIPLNAGDHLTGPQIDPSAKGTGIGHKGVVCRASSGSTEWPNIISSWNRADFAEWTSFICETGPATATLVYSVFNLLSTSLSLSLYPTLSSLPSEFELRLAGSFIRKSHTSGQGDIKRRAVTELRQRTHL